MHDCAIEGIAMDPQIQNSREYGLFELNHHIETECPKSKCCLSCKTLYETIDQYIDHIKEKCPHVLIFCEICQKQLKRIEYLDPKTHHCLFKHRLSSGSHNNLDFEWFDILNLTETQKSLQLESQMKTLFKQAKKDKELIEDQQKQIEDLTEQLEHQNQIVDKY